MRKWLIVTSILIFVTCTGLAFASSTIKILVNGEEIKTDVPPQIINGHIMLPIRWVANALDASVVWDEENKVVNIEKKRTTAQKALTGEMVEKTQRKYSFVQGYHGMKYPVASGLRKYIGKEPLRIYPNSKAPYVYEDYKPEVVELINEVQSNQDTWCLILDSKGISGYVLRSDLKMINEEEKNSIDYRIDTETLGGFKLGDRIETLIGRLDQDYYLIYENGRIYEFPDEKKGEMIDPIDRPFSETCSLEAFVGETNHVNRLRTDSPEFPLEDGYKVGDNAIEVLDFYASKYDYLDDPEMDYRHSGYRFNLNNGNILEFTIDSEELNQSSVIASISIVI